MFLHSVSANDPRFKTLHFHDGMNLLVARRTVDSSNVDSRNGAGKTSLILILRYLLGGSIDRRSPLKADELSDFSFTAHLSLPSGKTIVTRPTRSQTKLTVNGASVPLDEWKKLVGSVYGLDNSVLHPTVGELVAQSIRTEFDHATKVHASNSKWEIGARIGYLLGLSPKVLNSAGEIYELKKSRQSIRHAIKNGAFPGFSMNEAEIRSALVSLQSQRDNIASNINLFKVDKQYASHQKKADELSQKIHQLNDGIVILRQRQAELQAAIQTESEETKEDARGSDQRLRSMYQEIGIVLPEASLKRYEDVRQFHHSVVRNRRLFLQSELESVGRQLAEDEKRVCQLDEERASIMQLLESSMALETFHNAQQELNELDAKVEDLRHQLDLVHQFTDNGLALNERANSTRTMLRIQLEEKQGQIDEAIALFNQLGREVYGDRTASLIIEDTTDGILRVEPRIQCDASAGIAQVETFILDMVCLNAAIKEGRSPRFLVHDSRLFDSMDDRQITSCLNIGARLADEIGFQYIVTLNSDRLEQAESIGFDAGDYIIDPILTDAEESGGLFGFRFG